ncbi:hypothetical protein BofuT4_uP031320.1 [Botrytis cinerea T4]|uniref:Uncharacterized protein n=1 Tax=Botryotinia fuckeliana (strain T4) TaxID=999810 RepID=G2Y9I0_BOTF4|nr:hypothetical protein BofuT4_uP031320.1 [Botrytis cinerea T4]
MTEFMLSVSHNLVMFTWYTAPLVSLGIHDQPLSEE